MVTASRGAPPCRTVPIIAVPTIVNSNTHGALGTLVACHLSTVATTGSTAGVFVEGMPAETAAGDAVPADAITGVAAEVTAAFPFCALNCVAPLPPKIPL